MYLFKWANEDDRTWETRDSYERWGGVDYEQGMSREAISARCDTLDEDDDTALQQPQKKRKKKQ